MGGGIGVPPPYILYNQPKGCAMMNAEARWDKGFREGWHSFVEGYDYPEPDDTDEAFTDGLYAGWDDAESNALPIPEYVEKNKMKFFETRED